MRARYLILLAGLLNACVSSPSQKKVKKPDSRTEFWRNLVEVGPSDSFLQPGWSYAVQVPGTYLKKLPPEIRRRQDLRQLTWLHQLEKPRKYDKGVLGKRDDANFFVALKKDIPNFKRLYWVMVRVLSKEYGCFMRGRFELGHNAFGIVCRDKRLVVFHQSEGTETIEFNSRQYDRFGHELIVRNRKVIRRGRQGVMQLLARKRRQDREGQKVVNSKVTRGKSWQQEGRAAALKARPSGGPRKR